MQIDVLKAGWCKIGEKDGAKAIADLILFNTTLTTLDLRGNGLSNPGRTPCTSPDQGSLRAAIVCAIAAPEHCAQASLEKSGD